LIRLACGVWSRYVTVAIKLQSHCPEKVHSVIRDEDCKPYLFTVADFEKGLNAVKNGNASSVEGLSEEIIVTCHPAIIVHLNLLFNMIYYVFT